MIRRLYPTLLQGDITKCNYFEGWFQKIYVPELNTSIIIIYGIATGNELTKTGFIQLFIPGNKVIHLSFPHHEITLSKIKHEVRLGPNFFSCNQIHIENELVQLDAELITQSSNVLKKNSMGSFYLVPNLPCYHAVLQINSSVIGQLKIGEKSIHLSKSYGYLEKNWGISFPEKYFWMHAQDPLNSANQLLYSQAEVKWRNKTYIKHVGFIQLNGKCHDLRIINKKHIICRVLKSNQYEISVIPIGLTFCFDLSENSKTTFKSPLNGKLCNQIIHNINVPITLQSTYKKRIITLLLSGNIENSIYFTR